MFFSFSSPAKGQHRKRRHSLCSPRPDFFLMQISPCSRLHPAADFTPPQISPRPRFHPAPDLTPPQISPRPRFHPSSVSMSTQVPHPPRLEVPPDSPPVQIRRPARAAARPDFLSSLENEVAQKTPLRRIFSYFRILCGGGSAKRIFAGEDAWCWFVWCGSCWFSGHETQRNLARAP